MEANLLKCKKVIGKELMLLCCQSVFEHVTTSQCVSSIGCIFKFKLEWDYYIPEQNISLGQQKDLKLWAPGAALHLQYDKGNLVSER